ncbi:MAG TPA: glycosyltransferase [Chloroflexota bacterium]|nr:glycosyltransferase [Chloroflexota bacterium]
MYDDTFRVGYVVKRYPRFSETFIVNEILAHERAGVPVHIFALRRVNETHFQSILAQVRSPVTYIPDSIPKVDLFWAGLNDARAELPGLWDSLEELGPADALDVHQAVALASRVRQLGISHLHAHFGTVATTVTRLAARFANLNYTFTAHAKDIFHADVDTAALHTRLADSASVVTVSDFNVGWIAEHYGAVAPVRRIYNGLDLKAFPYRSPEDRPPHILGVGRLVEKKGFETLVQACAVLRDRGVPFTCTIIGEGPLREPLIGKVKEFGLTGQVVLVGNRPQCDVIAALHGAAVFAAPCVLAGDGDRDGLPTVLVEAMALGTPCISTDVTGIPELVRDGETGLLVPQSDPVALAGALARLLTDTSLGLQLAVSARRLIEKEFDVDRNAAELRSLFRDAGSSGTEPWRIAS